jgi:hypothetical protein
VKESSKLEVLELKSSTFLEKQASRENINTVGKEAEVFKLSESNSSGKLDFLASKPEEEKIRA